jgi:hypothetical protein
MLKNNYSKRNLPRTNTNQHEQRQDMELKVRGVRVVRGRILSFLVRGRNNGE